MANCKHCNVKFEQKYFNIRFCLGNNDCILAFNNFVKEKKEQQRKKEWNKQKKTMTEDLETKPILEKKLQTIINTIVRLIDKGSFCHSTKKPLNAKYDAGHFYSVGSNNTIRFNLFNIYAQSVHANQHLSGDQLNFLEVLRDVYGDNHAEYVLSLKSRYKYIGLTIEELREKIIISKKIVNELKKLDLTYSKEMRLRLRQEYNKRIGIY